MTITRTRAARITSIVAALTLAIPASSLAGNIDPDTEFYVATPNPGAIEQITELLRARRHRDAALILNMITTPVAEWYTQGTPKSVQRDVRNDVNRAAARREVPVLVAYNIPFRDCAQFSAGGATTVAEYKAWIDGFAAGIGQREAIVILEPDGLGIIPWYTNINNELEWCQPAEANPATAAAERFEMLNYAVDELGALANTVTYLDGTHSGWLGVGDAADRLDQAGIDNADGFFLNVSNYQFTSNQVYYGTWISQCLAQGDYANCANQYWNGGPLPSKIAMLLGEWTGVALSPYGEWSEDSDDPALNVSGYSYRFWGTPETHFVIDTSRNGVGPWDWAEAGYSDAGSAQDWCNPPDRGLGLRPTADTGNALVDAYLWIKVPGESDGECTRGLGPAGTTVDPEWGRIDPAAGAWFPEQALQLAKLANPELSRSRH